jgi:prolyl oligopeptidase
MAKKNNPPVAPIKPVIDNYFGIDVVDNYRYMESFNDEAVQQWVKAQADFANSTLEQLPGHDAFFNRMMELEASVSARVFGIVRLSNGKIFYQQQGAQDDVAKLYVRDSIVGKEILLVDPNQFQQETGKIHAINEFRPSWDGRYVICTISANGSEDSLLYVINEVDPMLWTVKRQP